MLGARRDRKPRSSPRRLAGGLLAFALIASACGELEMLSTEEALERLNVSTTRVYAADGSLLASLHGEVNREIVTLEDIPEHVQAAVIAIEDQRFWTHPGIDARSITRAAVENLQGSDDAGGRIQGGSTLSQQLVKNLYFPEPSRTLERKLAEARITLQFEQQYDKPQILEMYLNTVYFGRGVYGIQTAAQSYFSKDAEDLTVAEAAYLAGLIHEPARYEVRDGQSPEEQERRLERGEQRRNTVISRMVELELIEAGEAKEARAAPIEVAPRAETRWRHPYFVDMVLKQLGVLRSTEGPLDERFSFLGDTSEERARNVHRGGLRIYTTLDPRVQGAAEEAVSEGIPEELDRLSASLAAVEPETGYVRALVGGRDYYPECDDAPEEELPHLCRIAKVNLAIGEGGGGAGRQPGSSFKTFVLAKALEQGISLRDSYSGAPFTYRQEGAPTWNVTNYVGSGGGTVDLIEATTRSVNAAYARLIIEGVGEGDGVVGASRVAELARRMGIGFPTPGELEERCGEQYQQTGGCTPADQTPSIALGAKETSPLDMASAYGTLANDGVAVEPSAVVRITDREGRTLYEADPGREQVLPAPVARGVTYTLEQVVKRGTATRAQIGRPVAAKTGTSQAWRDAWLAGYVPQLSAAVWVGNPIPVQRGDGRWELESLTPANGYPFRITGGSLPAAIWGQFMRRALDGIPVEQFDAPPRSLFTPVRTPAPAVEVPDVVGLPRDRAVSALRGAGFRASESRCLARERPEGIVVQQSPSSGADASRGSRVSICLSVQELPSDDRDSADEPDEQDEADDDEGEQDSGSEGTTGSEENRGSSPSDGANDDGDGRQQQQGTVPNVVGDTLARARSELSRAGYESATVSECDPSGEAKTGRVWRQNPGGGSRAERGSTVTIWYDPGGC